MKKLINAILDLIYPSYCLSCNKTGEEICKSCINKCSICENQNPEWIYSIYDYKDIKVKKAIWLLKYKNRKSLAEIFARILHEKISEEISERMVLENFKNPILIPIPLSSKREKERGYNQALLICKELEKLNENLFKVEKNVLIKPKETTHQAHIKDRNQRLKNIVGSFAVKNPIKIKNQNIILIDDVTTTGATLSEAKKTLKQNGAKKIIAFTIAH